MGFTYAPNLKPEPDITGKVHAVRIRITKNKKSHYYNCGIYIAKRFWNKRPNHLKENWVTGMEDAPIYNNAIKDDLANLMAMGLKFPGLSSKELRDTYKQAKENPTKEPIPTQQDKPDFLALFREDIDSQVNAAPGTIDNYNVMYNRISRYAGGSLTFDRLTLPFLKGFITAMEKEEMGSETIYNIIGRLKKVAKTAMLYGLLPYSENPFHHITYKKKRAKKKALPTGSIEKLEALTFDTKKTRERKLEVIRDMFLFQYYLHGARVMDIAELAAAAVKDRIRYEMRKNKKDKSVLLTPELSRITAKYLPKEGENRYFLFPLLDNSYTALSERAKKQLRDNLTIVVNRGLKELAIRIGVENFTSHASRRTFTNDALKYVDLYIIKEMLNHSSILTTEVYVQDFKEGGDDKATEMVYSKSKTKVKPKGVK